MRLLIEYFQRTSVVELQRQEREEVWYQDWLDYQARHGIYAELLTPAHWSDRGLHLNFRRLTRFLEVFAYFSPSHAYSLHVTFLGLFPILISRNEELKREAIATLSAGGLLAFAVSEKDHGADLLANEFAVHSAPGSGMLASGSKYYIGNANAASIVSILGRRIDASSGLRVRRAPFVFFALRPPASPAYHSVQKIRTLGIRNAFVGEFQVSGHPVLPGDIISEGRDAWEAMFGTIDFGKFFLGFGAIGIASHAFAEAWTHLTQRVLYDNPVIRMAHVRRLVIIAFGRLVAMRLYAFRALDYLQASCATDRRYLLFNSVQKAKVSTEGVKVIRMLSECLGAKGFEATTYFEMALRSAPLIPELEGSAHINFSFATQFIDAYFAEDADGPSAPPFGTADENSCRLGIQDRHTRSVRFPDCLSSWRPLKSNRNGCVFVRQVTGFRQLVALFQSSSSPMARDPGFLTSLGRCFATVAQAQLVAEHCVAVGLSPSLASIVFHGMIEDLSAGALELAELFPPGSREQRTLRKMVRVPRTTSEELSDVFTVISEHYS